MLDWNRILSLLVAAFYIISAYWLKGGEIACKAAIAALFPTACIWFSEQMGEYVGNLSWPPITARSPGFLVCLFGWVLLLLPIILAGFQVFAQSKP
jgi:hypothetical protein